MKTRSFLKLAGLPLLWPFRHALAQSGPTGAIRVIVPLGAGTSADQNARILMAKVSTLLNQSIIVENRPGANGVIGTMGVVRAKPDGQTLLFASNSPLATNVALVKALPYDPLRDLTPIAGGTVTINVVLVKASSRFRTFTELLAAARQNPGKVSVGYGTSAVQIQVASMNAMAGVNLLPVPYKTTPDAVTNLLGGIIDATITDPSIAIAQLKAGQARVLAVTSLKRSALLPDVPAVSETLAGFDFTAWGALAGPPGMPRELVNKLSNAMREAQKDPEVIERLASDGKSTLVLGPEELKPFMEAEIQKWQRLARESNIQPE